MSDLIDDSSQCFACWSDQQAISRGLKSTLEIILRKLEKQICRNVRFGLGGAGDFAITSSFNPALKPLGTVILSAHCFAACAVCNLGRVGDETHCAFVSQLLHKCIPFRTTDRSHGRRSALLQSHFWARPFPEAIFAEDTQGLLSSESTTVGQDAVILQVNNMPCLRFQDSFICSLMSSLSHFKCFLREQDKILCTSRWSFARKRQAISRAYSHSWWEGESNNHAEG